MTENYDAAIPLLNTIIENKTKVSTETLCKAKTYKLNILMFQNKEVEAQELYESFDSKEKDYLKHNYSVLTIRASILYYGIIEKADTEVQQQLKYVKKALEKETLISRENEKELLEKAKDILEQKKEKAEAK